MYKYKTSKNLDKILIKLSKKDKALYEQVLRKINEIVSSESIEHYKNLRNTLKDYRRVHMSHFVLTFRFDKSNNIILFQDFDHYDNIYRRRL
mgnify:CR=1 FL=1